MTKQECRDPKGAQHSFFIYRKILAKVSNLLISKNTFSPLQDGGGKEEVFNKYYTILRDESL